MIYNGHFKLDIQAWINGLGESVFGLSFLNVTNLKYCSQNITQINIAYDTNNHLFYATINEEVETYDDNNIGDLLSGSEGYIEFDADLYISESFIIDDTNDVIIAVECDFLTINGVDGKTTLMLYRLNDEKDKLNKNLTFNSFLSGKFKAPLGIKNIEIDVSGYNITNSYNYVYIPILRRYYFITNIQFVNKDFTRLIMQEDVLMSWKELIKNQSAFITRYENALSSKIVDNRKPLEDQITVEYITPTMTASGSVNTTLSGYIDNSKFKILVSTISVDIGNKNNVLSPTGSGLSILTPIQSRNERIAFISYSQLEYLIGGCLADDNIMTYINSAVLLPFDPEIPYTNSVSSDGFIAGVVLANDKYLCDDYKFHTSNTIPSGTNMISCKRTLAGATPYFVVADFTFNGVFNNYLDYDPFTSWEIYVPFCGWIKINASQVLNKRIFVYYTLDTKTGMGTAYIYDRTNNKLIWSSNCQLGIKLDLTTTNATEIARQKEANELNMILGLMSSALAIGVGVATENPVAIAGGVLSAGKTIASNVNSNKMLFERAQTSFGTSEGAFHSPFNVVIRRSYHKEITINETTYKHLEGLPYNKYDSLTGLSGYVEIADIHFNAKDENIYSDEISEIVQLLKNGVIM